MEDDNYSMEFELSMRQFFGDKAYHIADGFGNKPFMYGWLKKACKKITKDIYKLETTERHRDMLLFDAEKINELINSKTNPWTIITKLFSLISRLLGYDYIKGSKYHNLVYTQNYWQFLSSKASANRKLIISEEDNKMKSLIMSNKKNIIKKLNEKGLNYFEISLILNTTEYDIRKCK